ncbi:MAG TPA: hypothetical protein VH917_00435, partial [Ignavibacteriaceae bacterium]
KALIKNISLDITPELAFIIEVRARSPEKSVAMAKFILSEVNAAVIDLNVKKSRENREFLEGRYKEISFNLASSEDSLLKFQSRSGLLEAENQIKSTIETFSKLESEVALKEIELAMVERIYGSEASQTKTANIAAEEFKKEVERLMKYGNEEGTIVPLSKLPSKAIQYFRYYRQVEIYNALLEFIIPLYEQARFEEVKDIPVIQIIDEPSLPEKKSYPPRILFALIFTVFVSLSTSLIFLFKEIISTSQNPKINFIKSEFFDFSKNKK